MIQLKFHKALTQTFINKEKKPKTITFLLGRKDSDKESENCSSLVGNFAVKTNNFWRDFRRFGCDKLRKFREEEREYVLCMRQGP